jgi:hypothetical protein
MYLVRVVHDGLHPFNYHVLQPSSYSLRLLQGCPRLHPSPYAGVLRGLGSFCGRYHLGYMMRVMHMRLIMLRFTLFLVSALVLVFGAAACVVGHTAYVRFAGRSLAMCLVSPWLSDLATA